MTSNSDQPREKSQDATTETTAVAARAHLTRLKINRFRHVKPGTELRFDDGINVLLGRNGTGKTTLLELVCAVSRGDLRAYEHESFDLEVDIQFGAGSVTASVRNTRASESSVVDPIARKSQHAWELQVSLSGPTEGRATMNATPRMAKVSLTEGSSKDIPIEDASPFQPLFHIFPFSQHWQRDAPLPAGAVAVALMVAKCCLRLDEGLDVFRCIVNGTDFPGLDAPLLITYHVGGPPVRFLYAPLDLLSHIHEQGPSLHEATTIDVDESHFEILGGFARAIDAKSIRCSMTLLGREKDPQSGATTSTFGKPSFWITTHRGTTYTHDQLSYGEKRLLAFMYHAAANPDILVADELVNGMHYEWIDACLDAIQGQAFLTSQNPLLLDHLSFESAEEVQRRFVLCDRDEDGSWIWRNMDLDAADAFYRAYEVGLQHVGEILRTSGLW